MAPPYGRADRGAVKRCTDGVTAVLDGAYRCAAAQDPVVLYDSHLRRAVRGALPSGARVDVRPHQANPVLDDYLVRGLARRTVVEGWVPSPLVRDVGRTPGAP